MSYPSDLLYSKDHEWVKIEDNVATVGVTAYAAGELGDVVYVEVETVGESLEVEATFGVVEAVKTVSDLYMPVSGEVAEFNERLSDEPELVNKDPYGEGWMIKINLADDVDTSHLMNVEDYKASVGA